MVSIISSSNYFVKSCHFGPHLSSPVVSSILFEINRKRRPGLALVVRKICGFGFGFTELGRRRGFCKGWESDGELALEGEILEFMKNSKKPNEFPTKKELVEAGRMDLVEGIVKEGGWLALGWDLDAGNEVEGLENDFDIKDFQRRVESCQESNSSEGEKDWRLRELSNSLHFSTPPASPSGRSIDMSTNEDTGIEGILSRLEKQRNLSFGIEIGVNGYGTYASKKDGGGPHHFGTSNDVDRVNHSKSSGQESVSASRTFDNSGGQINRNGSLSNIDDSRNLVNSNTWRTWSIQRAGSNAEFEAAEISLHENQEIGEEQNLQDKMVAMMQGDAKFQGRLKEIDSSKIRERLQHLELELSSALCSLRSKREKFILEGRESTSSDMQQLSDAWEFQETEFMNARDRLRSIRTKLAVLEGKMTLAVIDAQKIVDEKQKRISGCQRALQLLRSTCVVWPNSASEVLLAGSFDGWTTQRKMEKSRSGIFSLFLQLYPGRYEIKFIVDGEWRNDPLRPIVHNNGHENNILIIT